REVFVDARARLVRSDRPLHERYVTMKGSNQKILAPERKTRRNDGDFSLGCVDAVRVEDPVRGRKRDVLARPQVRPDRTEWGGQVDIHEAPDGRDPAAE